MLITIQQETRDFPTTWLSPVKSQSQNLKSDPSPFDVNQSADYWQSYRSLAGSPFDSSDSDSSSDCEDDTISLGSSDSLSKDVSLISEGIGTLDIMGSNALGLVFMSEEEVFEPKAIATSTPQAEGLQAPRNHQDDRSCGRPNQKCHAQQEHVVFQSDGPADEALVRRIPQAIGLWTDVSDTSGPNVSKRSNREVIPADREDVSFQVFQGQCEFPFENAHSFGGECDQPDRYDHILRAPRMKPMSLPDEEEHDLLYDGPDLGGWLTGTLDGVPKTMLGELSCLDIGLPMSFAMEV